MATQQITRDELTEALRSMRIWARRGKDENTAWRMHVLHPEDAANDILISVEVQRTQSAREEWNVESMIQQPLVERMYPV